ncbi:filamin-A [Folsomia candida]|uniref:filamin-A n=1 Tax=Folsomia candida TaxID=158441 RepID=UPI000B8FE602|nr:filamin-A [Folsomia candida]
MAELISVEGDALHNGVATGPNTFSINMAGMNNSKLVVAFTGPAKPQVMLASEKGGNIKCTYSKAVEGEYQMSVTFDDDHIEGSPFTVVVK